MQIQLLSKFYNKLITRLCTVLGVFKPSYIHLQLQDRIQNKAEPPKPQLQGDLGTDKGDKEVNLGKDGDTKRLEEEKKRDERRDRESEYRDKNRRDKDREKEEKKISTRKRRFKEI